MVRQNQTSAKRMPPKNKASNTDQILQDLEGVERMQLLQLTLIRELKRQVRSLQSERNG